MAISLVFIAAGFGLAGLALWGWCLYDVVTGTFKNDNDRIIWIILLLMIPVLGILFYLLLGREKRLN